MRLSLFCVKVCEAGEIKCLRAGHEVLTVEQTEAALRRRLERMQSKLLTEDKRNTCELVVLEQEVERAVKCRDAKVVAVQEGRKHLGSLEHFLDTRLCKCLSAEAAPFMQHLRAFEQLHAVVVILNQVMHICSFAACFPWVH